MQPSAHLHDFFGNRSTDSSLTYSSMTAGGTTCAIPGDTAGYRVPTLLGSDGLPVQAVTSFSYYKNKPVRYGTTVPFPPDYRVIAGGVGTFPKVYWDCFSKGGQFDYPPACGDDYTVAQIHFPNCWDGKNIDSPDHRSHVAYRKATPARRPTQSRSQRLPWGCCRWLR